MFTAAFAFPVDKVLLERRMEKGGEGRGEGTAWEQTFGTRTKGGAQGVVAHEV